MCHMCMKVTKEVRRRHRIAWNWSYKWVWTYHLGPLTRATNALKHFAIFPALTVPSFQPHSFLICFVIQHKTVCSGKRPQDMHTGQADGDSFSTEVHFPQITPVYVNLPKNNKHTSQFSFLIIKAETDIECSSCSWILIVEK